MLTNIKKRNQNQKGFTIIEVLIVLAIAGLILLIVFLAVPALQRSARNTQRKNDASAVAGAIANYISDNGGAVPDTGTISANGALTVSCTTGTGGCDKTDANTETAKIGFYGAQTIAFDSTGKPTTPTTTTLSVEIGYTCNASNTAIGSASPRTAAILFELEPASQQCLEQ
jgi:prepilin-type N-terminal cleavage/methylation domain-containing protein